LTISFHPGVSQLQHSLPGQLMYTSFNYWMFAEDSLSVQDMLTESLSRGLWNN